jgi:hypothetical protein
VESKGNIGFDGHPDSTVCFRRIVKKAGLLEKGPPVRECPVRQKPEMKETGLKQFSIYDT